MNPRLAKEFRPLLFPWCLCALAGLGHLAGRISSGGVPGFVMALAAFAFFAGCLLLAVTPFGLEFQNRTWPLLLAQPLERFRLWKEKFLAATIAVLALIAVHGAMVAAVGQRIPFDDMLPCVGFVVATICSAGFCTLAARSVIGGMAFAAGWQFVVMAVVSGAIYLCYKVVGRDPFAPEMDKWPVMTTYVCAGAVFSAFSLWLGRRTFAEMEVRDAPASANLALPDWMTPKKLATFFRCQPTGVLRNLIRKEVGLQKPIFTIAVVFAACWIVTFLLLLLQPTRHAIYVGTLNALTVIHITIITLLAGCVSLGDEKTLGLAAWHLTLPVSARRQWLVKLLVSAATAVLVGLVLPLFLACLTLVKAKVGLAALAIGEIWGVFWVLTAMWVVGVLGFWCATFWENTVRAALATVLAVIGIGACAQLAAWVSVTYSRDGLQTNLITSLIAHFRLPPDFFANHEAVVPCSVALVVLAVMLVALLQSLAQFRRAQVQGHVMLKYSLILAAVAFAGSFWCADLAKSIHGGQWALELEFQRASLSFWEKKGGAAVTDAYTVTSGELEQSGKLSENAKLWLKHSHVTFTPVPSSNSRKSPHLQVLLVFPDGKQYWFESTQRQPNTKKNP